MVGAAVGVWWTAQFCPPLFLSLPDSDSIFCSYMVAFERMVFPVWLRQWYQVAISWAGQTTGCFVSLYSTRRPSKPALPCGWLTSFLLDSTCWHLRLWMIQLNVFSSLSFITTFKLDILHMKITGYCELHLKGWFTEECNRQLLLASSDDFIPCCCFSNRKKLYLGWVSDPSHGFFILYFILVHEQSFSSCSESVKVWE